MRIFLNIIFIIAFLVGLYKVDIPYSIMTLVDLMWCNMYYNLLNKITP